MATSDSYDAMAACHRAHAAGYRQRAADWREQGNEGLARLNDGWAEDEDKEADMYERDFEAEARQRADAADTEAMVLRALDLPLAEATDETRNGEEQSNE